MFPSIPVHRWKQEVFQMKYCQGPDPETKTPNFTAPPKACDAHCHVFGPNAKFPFAEGRSYTPPDSPFEAMQVLQRSLGIERAVIVQATCHGTDNTAALDAIARSEDRYKGVAIVDNSFTDDDFKRLDEGGIRGIRFSFARHIGNAPDFAMVRRITERVAPLGWHVVIYMEAPDIIENADTLADLPLPVVIDHMGRVKTEDGVEQEAFQLLLGLLRDKDDFWVKICGAERISSGGAPFEDAVPFAQACIAAAPDRVLWGTDWPHPNIEGLMPNDGDLMNLLALHAPDEAVRNRILVNNPARLYGFPD
jgi:2-pyrone-4,6-dicarboxylate lactonase